MEGDLEVDASALADEFIAWLNRAWHEDPEEPGPLSDFFGDWASSTDLMGQCAGDHATALQAFIIACGRFEANPDEFGRCAPFISSMVHGLSGALRLRPGGPPTLHGYLNADDWQRKLFYRKYGTIDPAPDAKR
jgi:hypothetical protein